MRPFAELTHRGQVERLRRAARAGLSDFGLDPDASLRLLLLGFNATFRVDDPSHGRFALRINLNSQFDHAGVVGEASWVSALADEGVVAVPRPRRTVDGSLVGSVAVAGLDRPRPCVVYSWLDGPDVGPSATLAQVRALGRLAGRLHRHARTWSLPAGATREVFDRILLDSPDHLRSLPSTVADADQQRILTEALDAVEAMAGPVLAQPSHLIHADLHGWNTKRLGEEPSGHPRLGVLDFDDCGFGSPWLELVTAAFYLRPRRAHEHALLEGYDDEIGLPPVPGSAGVGGLETVFEALLMGRGLLLLNDLVATVSAADRELLPGYVVTTTARARHWLATGHFLHDPPEPAVQMGHRPGGDIDQGLRATRSMRADIPTWPVPSTISAS